MAPKFLSFSLLLCSLYITTSCQQDSIIDESVPADINNPKEVSIGIDENKINLSDDDASIVAQLFYTRENKGQGRAAFGIKNVVTITDDAGQPAIYAINLHDGYIFVSATKSYYPILAKVDHGTFSLEKEPTGENVIIQDMLVNIKAARDSIVNFECAIAWRPYEKQQKPERPASLSRSIDDDYWDAFNEWYDEITNDYTCKVYKLYNCNEIHTDERIIPDDIYERFCNIASDEDYWEGTEYNWKNTAYIVEKYNPGKQTYGPLTKTTWDQGAPYNITKYQALGCVTIAVGQSMKYYQHPKSIDWNAMPNNYASSTLQNFLASLREELKVNNNGGTTIENASRVLTGYGYNCSTESHNTTNINKSIRRSYPIISFGTDKNVGVGHAWITDGFETQHSYTEYTLYRLATSPNFKYIIGDGDNSWNNYSNYTYNYYHMNWGWGGFNDGWYLDNNIVLYLGNNETRNYSTNRKELIINSYR